MRPWEAPVALTPIVFVGLSLSGYLSSGVALSKSTNLR
jgi:hypothetical protein